MFHDLGQCCPAGGNTLETASARPTLDLDEDDDEALELGLNKKKRTSGAQANQNKRLKKSKDDIKQEQMATLRKEVQAVCSSVSGFPQTPQGQAIGRVDRMLQKRAKELKQENDYAG